MIIICNSCRKECKDFEFKTIGDDIKPLCRNCFMKDLVKEKESEFNESFNFKGQVALDRWVE